MPPRPAMTMRSFRIPNEVWLAAVAKADERNENLSEIIRQALERYVKTK